MPLIQWILQNLADAIAPTTRQYTHITITDSLANAYAVSTTVSVACVIEITEAEG